MRARAVEFAMSVILRSTDWEEVQNALADHDEFGPWLEQTGDPQAVSQAIIREAEKRLGKRLPAEYA